MADIDNSLRFKIKSYLLNYSLICKARLLDEESLKWVDYLEYGTIDTIVIGLQTLGIPRHLSNLIIENYSNCLDINDGIIRNFNIEQLKIEFDKNNYAEEYNELTSILDW